MGSTSPRKFSQNASIGIRRIVFGAIAALYGLSALAVGQETQVPENAVTNQTTVEGLTTYPEPPPGFNPLTASDTELRRYGFPPRPDVKKTPEAYRQWRKLVLVPRKGNPKLQPSTIYDGPMQRQ
jgi:hypothetical protein